MDFVTRHFDDTVWQSISAPNFMGRRVLKSNVAKCILSKLGPGYRHTSETALDMFQITPQGANEARRAIVSNFGNGPFVMSNDQVLADRVLAAIEYCPDKYVPPLAELQTKVAEHEGRRGFRTALKMKGPQGQDLPEEVARKIGKMSATKTIGGKRNKKSKKTKKQTRRR